MQRSGVAVVLLVMAALAIPLLFLPESWSPVLYVAIECLALGSSWVCWSRTRAIAHRAWFVLLVGWSLAAPSTRR